MEDQVVMPTEVMDSIGNWMAGFHYRMSYGMGHRRPTLLDDSVGMLYFRSTDFFALLCLVTEYIHSLGGSPGPKK